MPRPCGQLPQTATSRSDYVPVPRISVWGDGRDAQDRDPSHLPLERAQVTELQVIEGHVMADGEWSPEEAATHVSEAWQNAVDSIVETGVRLVEAKKHVGHGNWLPTVELLPFSEQTARALMSVARHPDLSNRQHVGDLPPSWGTLAVLAQLPPGEIPKRIEAGEITPELDRATAQTWVSTYAVAKQEALNAWSEAVDGLTRALSYAKTYTPPIDIPDSHVSVEDFIERASSLLATAQSWGH